MGRHDAKYREKQRQQRINAQENREYYQNGTDWKHPSSESEINRRRKLQNK